MGLLPAEAGQALKLFRRQYLQLWDQKLLSFPTAEHLRNATLQSLLYDTIFKPGVLAYPPPERYQLRVLKELVVRVEKSVLDPDEDEVSEDLLLCLSNLLASPMLPEAVSAQQKSYVTYTMTKDTGLLGEGANVSDPEELTVTLLESRAVLSASGVTGFRTWEAALHLGSYLTRSPSGTQLIKNRNVLELGAGTGLLSVLCANHLSARRVLATDGAPAVVEALETNFFLNGLENSEEKVSSSILKWGWTLPGKVADAAQEDEAWDIAIGADVTYDATTNPYLVSTLRDLFDKFPSIEVIISVALRNEDTIQAFIRACGTNEFVLEDVAFDPLPIEDQHGPFYTTVVPIRILRATRPTAAKDPWAI